MAIKLLSLQQGGQSISESAFQNETDGHGQEAKERKTKGLLHSSANTRNLKFPSPTKALPLQGPTTCHSVKLGTKPVPQGQLRFNSST